MRDVMGIINDTCLSEDLKDLTSHRSAAAIPFGGRYRLVDFPLSNMTNSGIRNVGIFTQFKNRSLLEHLGSGEEWDLSSKRDGLFILPPMFEESNYYKNLGDVDYYHKHLDYIRFSRQKYVLIAATNIVCNIDLKKMYQTLMEKGADVVLAFNQRETKYNPKNHTILSLDGEKVIDIVIKPEKKLSEVDNLFLEIMLIKKDLFIDIINNCVSRGYNNLLRDGIIPRLKELNILAHKHHGFSGKIHNTCSYYNLSQKLLDSKIWKQLFLGASPILTRVQNEPPAKYCLGSKVKNSLIANGCVVEGTVINSILFRGVTVKKGAVIKDSIVMQKGVIGEGSWIENAILDKNIIVNDNVNIVSPPNYPMVIERRSSV